MWGFVFDWRNVDEERGGERGPKEGKKGWGRRFWEKDRCKRKQEYLDVTSKCPTGEIWLFLNFSGIIFSKEWDVFDADILGCRGVWGEPSVSALNPDWIGNSVLSVEVNKCHSSGESGLFNTVLTLFCHYLQSSGRGFYSRRSGSKSPLTSAGCSSGTSPSQCLCSLDVFQAACSLAYSVLLWSLFFFCKYSSWHLPTFSVFLKHIATRL